MKRYGIFLLLAGVCALPIVAFAQEQTNEGAQLVAPFAVVPPVIDGKISPGEWDGAGVAGGQWSSHNSTEPEDPSRPMTVKVKYGILGIYVLFDSLDTDPECHATGSERLSSGPTDSPYYATAAGVTFDWTGYRCVYIDPTGGASDHSYSIQGMPSMSVNGETDHNGNSYNYTEVGLYAGLKCKIRNPVEDEGLPADQVVYWANGGSWDLHDSRIADGMKPDGSGMVMEFFIAYSDLDGYYHHWGTEIIDGGLLVDVDAGIPETIWGLVQDPGGGFVTGMPAPGTVWEMQFGTHDDGAGNLWVNWVGDNSGFATKPFGKVIFGAVEPSAVREAMLHLK
jgi:hypothetical protein